MFNLPPFPQKTFHKVKSIDEITRRKNELEHYFKVSLININNFCLCLIYVQELVKRPDILNSVHIKDFLKVS